MQKVHVEVFSEQIDKNFDVSFSSTFFVLSCFRVFLSDESSKTLKKTFYKKYVSKMFYENRQKYPKPIFFGFVSIAFLAFPGGGSSITRPKNVGEKLTSPGEGPPKQNQRI
jgi:hypothetical protein